MGAKKRAKPQPAVTDIAAGPTAHKLVMDYLEACGGENSGFTRDENERDLEDAIAGALTWAFRLGKTALMRDVEADACKRCKGREYLEKLWGPVNNPHGYENKYGVDHGERLTIDDLLTMIRGATFDGSTDVEICDLLDREFFFGAWKSTLEGVDPMLLRNLRGLVVALARRAVR